MSAACTEKEYMPSPDAEFPKNAEGVAIPIRNMSIQLQDGTVIVPGLEFVSECDTAHFSGVIYSEDIVSVSYVLKEGYTIDPAPLTIKDSVEVDGKKVRKYWAKETKHTISNSEGESYSIVFLLDDFLTDLRPVAPEQLDLLWSDEFNTMETLPNKEVWKLCQKMPNAWSQHFIDGYWGNIKVENGYLKLKADKSDGVYRNGGIRTINGFPLNTRVEVKAKLTHKVRGGFPAIWQMPINGATWPLSGEIDIMEWIQGDPNRIYQTIHRCPQNNGKDVSNGTTVVCDITQWHTFGVDRTEESLKFYLDGQLTWVFNNPNNGKLHYPFSHYDFDIILNLSLGGMLNGSMTWPGPIKDEDLPGEMWVDWVRVYELPNE